MVCSRFWMKVMRSESVDILDRPMVSMLKELGALDTVVNTLTRSVEAGLVELSKVEDPDALRHIFHRLKGASMQAGALRLAAHMKRLEAREVALDLREVQALWLEAQGAFSDVLR